MEVNEQIVTGQKFRCLMDEAAKLWQRISFWTKANDVEFDDGMNAETKVGAISGITDSLASTSSHIAASAKAVHTLNNNFSSITTPGSISAFAYSDLAGVYHDTNLNDLKTPGFYSVGNSQFAASEKNYPVNGIGGVLEVFKIGTYSQMQKYYAFGGYSPYVRIFCRHFYGNPTDNAAYWSPWVEYPYAAVT